jgi:hypothetical protein
VAYQEIGSADKIDTSVIKDFKTYNPNAHFNPNIRSFPVYNTVAETIERSSVDLTYELDNNVPFRLINRNNIYRIEFNTYKVLSYDKVKGIYKVEQIPNPDLSIATPTITTVIRPNAITPMTFTTPRIGGKALDKGIDTIIEDGQVWVDTTEEDHGQQITVRYADMTTGGVDKVVRVTDAVEGFHNVLLNRNPAKIRRLARIQEQADKLWEDKTDSDTMNFPSLSETPLTKAEYLDASIAKANKWTSLGQAGHYLMQALIQPTIEKFEEYVDKARAKANDDISWNSIKWVIGRDTNGKVFGEKILHKAGINRQTDKLAAEVRVASKIWGFGSTIDLLVQHIDNTYSITDFKFGRAFNKVDIPFMMKYGRQDVDIWQTPKDLAKLEVMLRALMLKTEYPDIKFKNLSVLWTPSKYTIDTYLDNKRFVEVESYLPMIKAALKAEYDSKTSEEEKKNTIYGKLQELPHFYSIFDPNQYNAGYSNNDNLDSTVNKGQSDADLMKYYMEELKYNIMFSVNPQINLASNSPEAAMKRDKLQKAAELVEKISDLNRNYKGKLLTSEDISWMDLYTGNIQDLNNPYIQMYADLLETKKNKARDRFFALSSVYNQYRKPLDDHYYKRIGMKPPTASQNGKLGLWTNIDPVKYWEAMYFYEKSDEGEISRRLNHTDNDWLKAAERFSYLKDPQVMKDYRRMADFMMDNWEQFFVNEKGYYDDAQGKKIALANKPITWRSKFGKESLVTDLQLHLEPKPGEPKKNWEYKRGWFAKVPITEDEMGNAFTKLKDKRFWTQVKRYYFKSYIDAYYSQEENNDEALPWKYLGTEEIDYSDTYSKNLEESFLQSMKYYTMKEELTDVYALGRGLVEYAKLKNDDRTGFNRNNLIKFMEKMIEMQIRGRRQVQFDSGLLKQDIALIRAVDGKIERPDWIRLIRSLKSSSAGPIMILKPFQGSANAAFAFLYTLKESLKDGILSALGKDNFLKVDTNFMSFTQKELAQGWVDYMEFTKDNLSGNLENNKLWVIARKLGYLTNNTDFYANRLTETSTNRGRIWDKSSLYMFHTVPEEAITLMILSAQLKHMKIKSDDKYNGRSLWSMYSLKKVKDEVNNEEYTDLVWEDDYIRGYINDAPEGVTPNYIPVKGLTTDEVRKLKYVYQRMHGGYRQDEQTYLEYFVLGEVFMQFKKFLPTLLRNAGQSRTEIKPYGYYKAKLGPDGKPLFHNDKEIVEWHSRIVEGRFKVLLGVFLNFMSIRHTLGDNSNLFHKFLTMIGIQSSESYEWDNLPEQFKEQFVDAFVTSVMYIGLLMIYLNGGGGEGEDDPYLKWVGRVKDNFLQSWNPAELATELLKSPNSATAKVTIARVQAITDLNWSLIYLALGDEQKALTKQGTLKGTNSFIKNWIPYGGTFYDFVQLMLGKQYVDEYTIDQFRGN